MSKIKKQSPEDQERQERSTVKAYLTALEQRSKAPKPRWREPEIRLASVVAQLQSPDLDVLKRVGLVQERIDIVDYLASSDEEPFLKLEREFLIVAGNYGERKGISYAAWRACGVSPAVLKEAGIKP